MSDPHRKRRALTHVGGTVNIAGEPDGAKVLARALDVAPSRDEGDDDSRLHVHGFHTYPARMHPETAARLVRAFVPAGGRVLDPFCGSGTVLVEALLGGRCPLGVDLNPLAVRLARCKSRPREAAELERLVAQAHVCATWADQRRKSRAGATRRFPDEDVRLFEPHVLLELDSLWAAIESLRSEASRLDLSLVLSAVLVKFSKMRGDTSARAAPRRTAAGFATRFFVLKAEDLARRLAGFRDMLPTPAPPPAFVAHGDATQLKALPGGVVEAIVTSPPYAATYDYVAHHALRLRWLGLDAAPLAHGEMGARATFERTPPDAAREVWSRELAGFFHAAARMLPAGRPLVLVMADSAVGTVALRADEIVADVARECGFYPAARASQARPHFHGPTLAAFRDRPRAEHALLLRRV